MDFGLGLVLSFTDNASAGINNAVNSLDKLTQKAENASNSLNQMASLSAISVVSNQIGSGFLKAGTTITGLFTNLLGHVQQTGSEFENFRITLNALYGDAEQAESAIGKLLDFSMKSPFEVDGVKDMLIVLKSQGIDAFSEITGSIGEARQESLSWIADLMAFKPDEATQRWKRALTNYLGSGEDRMLRNILDMGDIEQILGHEMGSTAEERMNDIVEIVEKSGLTGLAQNLSTTWTGVASNIGDAFTKLYKAIADNGVFENLKTSFMSLSGAILSLDGKQIEALGKTIADGLNIIITPITKVVGKVNSFITSIVKLCETRPELVKLGMVLVAIAGGILLFVGVMLKATSAFSGLSLMILASGQSFGAIGGIIKTGILKMLGALIPFIATIGILALAWKSDFASIRTSTTFFVNGLTNSFKTARQAVNGSVQDLVSTLTELRNKDDFFSNLTIGIMKVMMVSKALADGWNDYSLSEENFLKAKELGVLPLIEAILDLKYRFGFFKQGFIEGWKEIGENVKNSVMGFLDNVEGTALESLVDNLTEFLQKLASGDTQAWYDFGQSFAQFTADALLLWGVLKAIGTVTSVISPLVKAFELLSKFQLDKVFGKVGTGIMNMVSVLKGGQGVTLFSKLVEVFKAVATGASSLKEALTVVFGGTATVIAGITAVVSGVALAVTGFVKQLVDGFSWFWEIVKWVGLALATVGVIILAPIEGVGIAIAALVAGIIGIVTTAIVLVKQYWTEICDFFSTIGSWIYNNVIVPIANFFVGLWNGIVNAVKVAISAIKNFLSTVASWIDTNVIQPTITFFSNLWSGIVNGVTTAINSIKTFLGTVANWIYSNVIQPIVNFFMTIIYPFIEKIVEIVAKIIEIIVVLVGVGIKYLVQAVKNFVQNVITTVQNIVAWINTNIIQPIIGFFVGLWNNIVLGVTNTITAIQTFFGLVVSWINTNVVQPIINFFVGLWNNIVLGVQTFIANAISIIGTIVSWIDNNIIQPIATFFSTLWSNIVNGVTSFIANVITAFSTMITNIKNFFSPLVTFFQGVWNNIVSIFTTIGTAVSNAITNSVKGAINLLLSGAGNIINGFIRAINGAISVINNIPGVSISSLTPMNIPQLATGGVIEKPTMALVGEAGTEAVMPLENNTGWIGVLAKMITSQMGEIRPTNTSQVTNTSHGDSNQSYLTNNNTSNNTYEGDTDNSIVFNQGAIQVNVQNASEEEAMRMAQKIMEYIKRQRELDKMTSYA